VNTRRSELGVTMMELMVVVAIIGIVALVAAPNIIRFRDRYRLTRVANDYAMTVNLTRSQAISWNREMRIVHYPDSDPEGAPANSICAWDVQTKDASDNWETIPLDDLPGYPSGYTQHGYHNYHEEASPLYVPYISMTNANSVDQGDFYIYTTRGTLSQTGSSAFTANDDCWAIVEFRNKNATRAGRIQVCIGQSGIATLHSNANW